MLRDLVRCGECRSELLHAKAPDYLDGSLWCRACGEETVVASAISDAFGEKWDIHRMVKDGEDHPIGTCPHCDRETFVIAEDECAHCGEGRLHDVCGRCEASLSLDEQELDGYCSYCSHVADRARDD